MERRGWDREMRLWTLLNLSGLSPLSVENCGGEVVSKIEERAWENGRAGGYSLSPYFFAMLLSRTLGPKNEEDAQDAGKWRQNVES